MRSLSPIHRYAVTPILSFQGKYLALMLRDGVSHYIRYFQHLGKADISKPFSASTLPAILFVIIVVFHHYEKY